MWPVDIPALFDDLREAVRPLLAPRHVTLIVRSDVEKIPGDKTLLLSLLVNLVENAARA